MAGGVFVNRSKTNREAGTSVKQPEYRVLNVEVAGMVCPQCALAIEGFLETKEGIAQTSFSYQESSGSVVYDPQKIDKDKILAFGILREFYQADLVSDEEFKGEIEEKSASLSPEVEKREKKLKEASALLQLFLSARQKEDEGYMQNLKIDYLSVLDVLVGLDGEIEDEDEKREFRKRVLSETADQIYLVRPALPGESAYEIKKKAESIQIKLAVNPVLKTKSVFLAGNARLNEARELFGEDSKEKKVQTLVSEYKQSLVQSEKLIKLTEDKGKEKKQLLTFVVSVKELIREQVPKQEQVLIEIYGFVPKDISEVSQNLLAAVL